MTELTPLNIDCFRGPVEKCPVCLSTLIKVELKPDDGNENNIKCNKVRCSNLLCAYTFFEVLEEKE